MGTALFPHPAVEIPILPPKIIKSSALIFLFVACLLAACSPSAPASPPIPIPTVNEGDIVPYTAQSFSFGEKIKFDRLTIDPTITRTTITDIVQDKRGYIWIGTNDGLHRFDGYNLLSFRHDMDKRDSISSNHIRDLYVDPSGTLWIGTDEGLNRFNPASLNFTRYLHDPYDSISISHNLINHILMDKQGNLWVATSGGGLNLLDTRIDKFAHFEHELSNPNSLSSNTVGALYQDSTGALWVGTYTGLDRYDYNTGLFKHFGSVGEAGEGASQNYIRTLVEDTDGNLWIGTANRGLDMLDTRTGEFRHYQKNPNRPGSLSSNTIWTLMIDSTGTLWIGTEAGLNRFVPSSGNFLHYRADLNNPDNPENLSGSIVNVIYQDPAGLYWVGTDNGINTFSHASNRFPHYRHDPLDPTSLVSDDVTAFFEDERAVLWVGTTHGLDRYRPTCQCFDHFVHNPNDPSSLSSDNILAIFRDSSGKLWVGTDDGLNSYHPNRNRFSPFSIPNSNTVTLQVDLSTEPVTSIIEDSSNNLWFGTRTAGLIRYDRQTGIFTQYSGAGDDDEHLSSPHITAILSDREGILWVGTQDGGLNRLDARTGFILHFSRNPTKPASLSSNTVLSLYQDSRGVLWVGTDAGLNRYDPITQSFTTYHMQHGLPGEAINAILEDDQGRLWLTTDRGLSCFDVQQATFHNYDQRDGLQSNRFNPGASFRGKGRIFYIGGVNGYNAFNPAQIRDNTYLPPVYLNRLTQSGQDIPLDDPVEFTQSITIQWPRNYFEFELIALSYIQPEKNLYGYRLDGYETSWHQIGTSRFGAYTDLPGGKYYLHLSACNNDRLCHETGPVLEVTVIPPFWDSSMFRWGAIGFIVLLLSSSALMRLRSIQSRSRHLTQLVAERTREIEQRRQVAEGLRDILILLNSDKSLEESLNFILCQIHRLLKTERALMFSIEQPGSVSILTSYFRENSSHPPCEPTTSSDWNLPDDLLAWFALQVHHSTPRVVDDVPDFLERLPELDCPMLKGMHTLVILPVQSAGEIYGGLIAMFSQKRLFSFEEIDLLNSFSDQAALAVGNSRLRATAEELAVVSERTRLARDLHDAVTQTLFSASLIAEALPAVYEHNREDGQELLKELRQLTRGAMAEMRTLLMELRPSTVIEARLGDLLHQLAEAITGKSRLTISLDIQGVCTLPGDVHVGLYRIAQEALNNIVKHAEASEAVIRLYCTPDEDNHHFTVLLEICDNGRGFEIDHIPTDHFGMRNIHERGDAIGAMIDIISQPGCGTTIRTTWHGEANRDGRT